MFDLTLQHIVMRISAVLLITAVHGWTLARTSVWLGDRGPLLDGRLGVSPLRHLDIVGAPVAVLFTLGWIRPMTIDPQMFRRPRISAAGLILAPALATLAMALLLCRLRPFILPLLGDTEAEAFFVLVDTVARLSASFTLFNLLPLPPLTGYHLLAARWPDRARRFTTATRYAYVPMALLVASGLPGYFLTPAAAAIATFLTRGS